jgi:hypothetical protein
VTFSKGDKVRVTLEADVYHVNSDGTYDLGIAHNKSGGQGGGWADDISMSKMTLVKKATPPQPPIGSLVQQDIFNYSYTYVRKPDGRWYGVASTNPGATFNPLGYLWSNFDHANIYQLIRSSTPVTA